MRGIGWPPRVLPAVAALLALWSVVPLAIWWDGAEPAYFAGAWSTWGWGAAIAALLVVLLLAVSKGRAPAFMLRLWRRLGTLESSAFVILFAALFAILAVLMCLLVFDGNPRNVDGFAQLFQARIFQAGRLYLTPPPELGNFATLQMVLGPERWYSQYPYGQPLVLAAALSLGRWWLLNPLIAAALAICTFHAARWVSDESGARLSLVLLCLSPFAVAMAGSEMSHLSAATLGIAGAAAAIRAIRSTALGALAFAALAGLALGLMTGFRPLDAVAAAAPVALVLGGWGARRLALFAATAAGGILGSVPTLAFNAATTGSWRRFGYEELWGPDHSLGFHDVPFGVPLTLTRAIARSGMDLHQLNAYLLDTTLPVLLVLAAGFLAGRRLLGSRDAVPFAGVTALMAVMFAYWHRDTFYGPRFLFSALPWFIILVARALVLLRRSSPGDAGAGPVAAFAALVALLFGLATITPGRLEAYRRSTPLFALHPDRDAARAGLRHAVVLIPDGWGSRLIARMWAAGIPVRRSTRLYGAMDACALEQALDAHASAGGGPETLARVLDSLAALGRPGARLGVTDDPNLRLAPNESLPAECRAEIDFDRQGFYSFAPYLHLNRATLDGDVVFARDLRDENGPLLRRYADRRFYRYLPRNGAPTLVPLNTP